MKKASEDIPKSILVLNAGQTPTTTEEWRQAALSLGRIVDHLFGLRIDFTEREHLRALLEKRETDDEDKNRLKYYFDQVSDSQPTLSGAHEIWDALTLAVLVARVDRAKRRGVKQPIAIRNLLKRFGPAIPSEEDMRLHVQSAVKYIGAARQQMKRDLKDDQNGNAPPFIGELLRSGLRPSKKGPSKIPDEDGLALQSPEERLRSKFETLAKRKRNSK